MVMHVDQLHGQRKGRQQPAEKGPYMHALLTKETNIIIDAKP